MRVREPGRPEGGGTVEKLRPQGMVVVRERDGYTRQRPEAALVPVGFARSNPKAKDAVRVIPVEAQYLQRNVAGILRSMPAGGTPRERMSKAYRIALGRLQRYGYVQRGSTRLTAKGRAQAQVLASQPEHAEAIQAYEAALALARKGHAPRVVEYPGQAGFVVQPGARAARTSLDAAEMLAAPALGPDEMAAALARAEAKAQQAVREIKAAKKKPAKRPAAGKKAKKVSSARRRGPSPARVSAGKKAAAARKRSTTGAFIKGNPVARGMAFVRANGGGGRSPTAPLVEKMKRRGFTRATSEGGVEMVFLPEHDLVMAILSSDHLRYLRQALPGISKHWTLDERAVERRVDEETLREYLARGMRVILADASSPGVKLLAEHAFPEGVAAIKGVIYRDRRTGQYHVGGMAQTFSSARAAADAQDLLLRRGAHFKGRAGSGYAPAPRVVTVAVEQVEIPKGFPIPVGLGPPLGGTVAKRNYVFVRYAVPGQPVRYARTQAEAEAVVEAARTHLQDADAVTYRFVQQRIYRVVGKDAKGNDRWARTVA